MHRDSSSDPSGLRSGCGAIRSVRWLAGRLLSGRWLAGQLLVAQLLAGCGDPCDSAELRSQLASAAAGDEIVLAECVYEGPFEIPAGVTLTGAGRTRTRFEVGAGEVALSVITGEAAATLTDLSVHSEGCAALSAMGTGELVIERVRIEAHTGVGIAVEEASMLQLVDVEVRGAIGSSPPIEIPLPPYSCEDASLATHGVVTVEVGNVQAENLDVRGFAGFGALFVDSTLTMVDSSFDNNLGTGLEVFGGSANLQNVELCRSQQGTLPIESFNALFAGGADVMSQSLTVCAGDTFGLMHDGSNGEHVNLVAQGNGFAGVWSQNADRLTIAGDRSSFESNRFAGIAALSVTDVDIQDATVRATGEGTVRVGETGSFRGADGLHLLETQSVVLSSLLLEGNERVGLLIDVGGGTTALSTTQVQVLGSGNQLGAIAQNGDINSDWDSGVDRDDLIAANDAAVSGTLQVAGVISPLCLPNPIESLTDGITSLLQ